MPKWNINRNGTPPEEREKDVLDPEKIRQQKWRNVRKRNKQTDEAERAKLDEYNRMRKQERDGG